MHRNLRVNVIQHEVPPWRSDYLLLSAVCVCVLVSLYVCTHRCSGLRVWVFFLIFPVVCQSKAQARDTRSPSAAPGGAMHLSAHLLGTERQSFL